MWVGRGLVRWCLWLGMGVCSVPWSSMNCCTPWASTTSRPALTVIRMSVYSWKMSYPVGVSVTLTNCTYKYNYEFIHKSMNAYIYYPNPSDMRAFTHSIKDKDTVCIVQYLISCLGRKCLILPYCSLAGQEHNFGKINTNNLGTPYDYNSVMHYSRSVTQSNSTYN